MSAAVCAEAIEPATDLLVAASVVYWMVRHAMVNGAVVSHAGDAVCEASAAAAAAVLQFVRASRH